MYEKLVRFKIIKNDDILEALLDERLSFIDNLRLLNNLVNINTNNIRIYDPIKKIFLNSKIPIKEFYINSFMIIYLF